MQVKLLWSALILSNIVWLLVCRGIDCDRKFQVHERQFCDQSYRSCLDRESTLLRLYGSCIK